MSYEGTVILNYRLGRKLGEGGFGSVYLAEHTELGRKSACKILHREFASKADIVERFFREAKAVCAIGNRAIIEIENFGRLTSGEPFYLMEYFPGEALADRITRTPLRPDEAIAVFDPVASALAAAHRKNIIHRDLKPENIMILEEDGRIVDVKLLDFGIAKLLGDGDHVHSRSGMPMGTPAYMAPEQARDSKNVDARADVYSFGATVFAAFTGRAPFSSDSIAGLLLKVQTDPPASLAAMAPAAPAGLQQLLERCMAKDPTLRPASITEAWREIQGALRGVSAPPSAIAATLPPNAPTIAPTVVPAPPVVAAHTTLGGAAAQSAGPHEARPRWPWIAAAIGISAIVIVAVIGLRKDTGSTTSAGSTITPDIPDAAAVAANDPIAHDAQEMLDAPAAVAPDATTAEPPKPKRRVDPPKPPKDPPKPKLEPSKVEIKVEPPKPDPPRLDCSLQSFARVYEQEKPPEEVVRGALGRLRRCESQLSPERYKQIQQNLVSKL